MAGVDSMGGGVDSGHFSIGARNLLLTCAELEPEEKLLLVREDPALGWYEPGLCEAIAAEAHRLGLSPDIATVSAPGDGDGAAIGDIISGYDCTVFLARIGDQDRFAEPSPHRRAVMVYARDAAMLACRYGRTDHRAMMALKQAVNQVMATARRIEVSCPLGTRISGAPGAMEGPEPADVCLRRFPLGVPAPVAAAGFTGRVALTRWLTPTGSQPYEPDYIDIESVVFAELEQGRIARFTGSASDVKAVEAHYDDVAGRFGIERNIVHSWHAGIHPGCGYAGHAAGNPGLWANTIFNNPRFLHFHTCGAYAPGEICWMVLDPTVTIDGAALWDNGRLHPERFAPTAECMSAWPELQALIETPEMRTGL